MHTNNTNTKLIYPGLSYLLTGICFQTHNELGRYAREKQYANMIEGKLIELKIPFKREFAVGDTGNIIDFLVDDKIIIELKAKRFVLREDYYQIQRYLQITNIRLGFIVNFRNRYLKPVRVVKIDTVCRKRFV